MAMDTAIGQGTGRPATGRAPRPAVVGVRLAGGSAASALITAAMVALGGALPQHPSGWSGLDRWVTSTPIDAVAVHAVWLVGVGLGAQLTVAHLLATGGWLARSTRTLRLAEGLSAGIVSRAWTGAVLGAATVSLLPAATAAAHTPDSTAEAGAAPSATSENVTDDGPATGGAHDDEVPRLRELADAPVGVPGGAGSAPLTPAETDSAPTMRLVTPAPGPSLAPAGSPSDVASVAPSLGVWLVRPGDSLWQIAEAVLERGPGVRGEIDAVHEYWQRLIELNRHNLADPDNPDLLFSGQQLRLPPHA